MRLTAGVRSCYFNFPQFEAARRDLHWVGFAHSSTNGAMELGFMLADIILCINIQQFAVALRDRESVYSA